MNETIKIQTYFDLDENKEVLIASCVDSETDETWTSRIEVPDDYADNQDYWNNLMKGVLMHEVNAE